MHASYGILEIPRAFSCLPNMLQAHEDTFIDVCNHLNKILGGHLIACHGGCCAGDELPAE